MNQLGKKMLTYGAGGDGKISLKHHNLLQDYHELLRETDSMKTKLEITKQRKRSLLAEVSFLRKRYEYFTSVKSVNDLKEEEHVARASSGSQIKLISQKRISKKTGAHLHRLPPLPNSNYRRRVYSGKEAFHGDTVATLDLNHRQIIPIGKKAAHNKSPLSDSKNKRRVNNASKRSAISHVATVIDLNLGKESPQRKRKSNSSKKPAFSNVAPVIDLNLNLGNDVDVSNIAPILDLNLDSSLGGREVPFTSRAPTFDLNEISTAEEDMQSNSVPLVELTKSLMRAGTDDQFNHDLKLSICRNSGEGPSRAGKQKISWQDPVALRV